DIEPGELDDRVCVSDFAPLWRTWIGEARRSAGAVRDGQCAVHLYLGELLAHDSPGHERRTEAAVHDGLPAVVLRDHLRAAVHRADEAAGASRRAAGARRCAVSWYGRTLMMKMLKRWFAVVLLMFVPGVACGAAQQPTPQPAQPSQQSEFIPIDQLPPQEQLAA